MQQRVLLIEPPYYRLYNPNYSMTRLPLSLAYLGAFAQKESKHAIEIYNSDFAYPQEPLSLTWLAEEGFRLYLQRLADPEYIVWKEIVETVSRLKPTIVGISAKSQNFASASMVARIVKSIVPQAVIVVGGPHATIAPNDVLAKSWIDLAVQGEGERTFVELLHGLESSDVEKIPGVCYRSSGKTICNAPQPLIEKLDDLPFPLEGRLILKDANLYPVDAFSHVFATRGCPYDCFFCGSKNIWSRRVRFRSPANIANEAKELQKLGVRLIHFEDDTFGVSKKNAEAISQAMKSIPGMEWDCELHVNLVEPSLLKTMKDAGCYNISLGIESGNDEILRLIKKNITIEKALGACRMVRSAGIRLSTFFMIGFPWETEETLQDTLTAMKACHSDYIIFSIFMPYPGTEAYDFCRQNGIILENFDPAKYNHQSPENCFCLNISRERFSSLVPEAIHQVEQLNRRKETRRKLKPATVVHKLRKLAAEAIQNM